MREHPALSLWAAGGPIRPARRPAFATVSSRGYTDHMRQTAAEGEMRTLIVTGPARDLLYEHFNRLYWGRGVLVVKDRRAGERRGRQADVAGERRNADRRRSSAWVVPPDAA